MLKSLYTSTQITQTLKGSEKYNTSNYIKRKTSSNHDTSSNISYFINKNKCLQIGAQNNRMK